MLFTQEFFCSIIDGKIVCNLTITQSCPICGATPKEMNNIDEVIKRPRNKKNYEYGLSTLHANIGSLEYMLPVAYRLGLQREKRKCRICIKEEKLMVRNRKTSMKTEIKKELGLLLDVPKVNSGNTNDGNSARRFFKNAEKIAPITGLDKSNLQRFETILIVLYSRFVISVEFLMAHCDNSLVSEMT